MTGDGKSSRGTGRKSRSGKTCETSRLFNPYRTMLEKGKYVEGFKEDEVHDALTKNPAPKGPPLVLISSAPDSPARTLASLGEERDSPESEAACSSSSPESSENSSRGSSSSRMFQACFLAIKDLISLSSSIRWTNSGTVWRGAFSIASSSESPNVAAECSLSDILVPHAHPKYSLSPRAAAGILRRAERRGKDLPASLKAALQELAGMMKQDLSQEPSTQQWDTMDTQDSTGRPIPTDLLPNPCEQTAGAEVTATEMRGMLSLSNLPIREAAETSGGAEMECAQPSALEPYTASVRRLTPTECERLQGMPDGWTHVHGAPMVGATPLWETLLRLWWPGGSGDES